MKQQFAYRNKARGSQIKIGNIVYISKKLNTYSANSNILYQDKTKSLITGKKLNNFPTKGRIIGFLTASRCSVR